MRNVVKKNKKAPVTGTVGLSNSILRYRRFASSGGMVVAILIAALVIPVAIYRSLAATATASLQGEGGTPSGNATEGTDANASGGGFLQFGSVGNFDFIVTSISMNPAAPANGNTVTFSAVVKNNGSGTSPAGTIVGVAFKVDGTLTSWSDTFKNSIGAGQSVTLTSNSGPNNVGTWTASGGTHSVEAFVDDVNRFPNESNENNNKLTTSITVSGGGGGPVSGSIGERYGASSVFYLGSLPPNIRNGVYADAKYAGVKWIRADLQSTTGDGVFVTETLANGLTPMPTIFRQGTQNSINLANWAYDKGVRVVMLDNEANLTGRGVADYCKYFYDVYKSVHVTHPDLTILTTGLGQTNTAGWRQWEWIDGYSHCAATDTQGRSVTVNILDLDSIGVGMHWYFTEYTPGVSDGVDWHWRGMTASGLQNWFGLIDSHTSKKPKIWITEMGYSRADCTKVVNNSTVACTQAEGEQKQVDRVTPAFNVNASWMKPYRDRLGPLFWFALINKNQDGAREENFGGWSYDSSHKYPVADSVKNMLAQPLQQ